MQMNKITQQLTSTTNIISVNYYDSEMQSQID
jgi:hypothetical protein